MVCQGFCRNLLFVVLLWAVSNMGVGLAAVSKRTASGMRLPRNECAGSTQVITDRKGIIQWEATQNCSATWQWNISVELSHHIVLQLRDLYLPPRGPGQKPDSLHIQGHFSPVTGTRVLDFRQGTSVPMPPVFVRSNKVLVQFLSNGNGSALKLTFSSYPSQTLPPETFSGKYRCSSPFLVPRELQCDFLEQCEEGEDESHCNYSKEGCNDWIPIGISRCFTVVNKSVALTPRNAESECLTKGANLAALYRHQEIKHVSKVFSLLGFSFVVVGTITLNAARPEFQQLYRFLWRWDYKEVTFFSTIHLDAKDLLKLCVGVKVHPVVSLQIINCTDTYHTFACLKERVFSKGYKSSFTIQLPQLVDPKWPLPLKTCPDGSFVLPFHPCRSGEAESRFASLMCDNEQTVHFSLTCDGFDDCDDGSDEFYCSKETVSTVLQEQTYKCTQVSQIISKSQRCDGKADCHDETDEERCLECQNDLVSCVDFGCSPKEFNVNGIPFGHCPHIINHQSPHEIKFHRNASYLDEVVIVKLSTYGLVQVRPMNQQEPCPETHVQCKEGPCIPSYFVNNQQNDCPMLEDEVLDSAGVNCSGYYRCYRYSVCLHPTYLCDGIFQCPFKDDEAYCHLKCPSGCICEGLSLICKKMFPAEIFAMARYLDLSNSKNMQNLQELNKLTFLFYLNLSFCGLTNVSLGVGLYHLRVLDLSFNRLTSISDVVMRKLSVLNILILSNNPLFSSLDETVNTFIKSFEPYRLTMLYLANTGIRSIPEGNFSSFWHISHLDLTDNPLKIFSRGSFYSFTNLNVLKTHHFTVCCFFLSLRKDATCEAPRDLLSSCNNLLANDAIRSFLIIIVFVLTFGNGIVLVYLLHHGYKGSVKGPLAIEVSLSISDFCTGIYLIIMLAANGVYQGEFDTYEEYWLESSACKVAGFVLMTCHMVKALLLCVDTVKRLLVQKSSFHFSVQCNILLCGFLWGLSLILAAVPLSWSASDWRSYSLTNTCVPYPISSQNSLGYWYAFVLLVLLSWLASMVVCCGQLYLFFGVYRKAFFSVKSTRRRDNRKPTVGRLSPAVVSNACCYAMVGFIAVLSTVGVEYYPQVNILAVILLLISNSTVGTLLQIMILCRDKRHKHQRKSTLEVTLHRLRGQIETWPLEALDQLIRDLYNVLIIMRKRERMEQEHRERMEQEQREQENQETQVLPNISETQATFPKDPNETTAERNCDKDLLTTDDTKTDETKGDHSSPGNQVM